MLAELYSWRDLSETDYRKQKRETETALATLPSEDDKLILFALYRAGALSMLGMLAPTPHPGHLSLTSARGRPRVRGLGWSRTAAISWPLMTPGSLCEVRSASFAGR